MIDRPGCPAPGTLASSRTEIATGGENLRLRTVTFMMGSGLTTRNMGLASSRRQLGARKCPHHLYTLPSCTGNCPKSVQCR